MGFLDLIQKFVNEGWAALAGTGVFGTLATFLLIKNNKNAKELVNKNTIIDALTSKIETISADLKEALTTLKNSNEIVSAVIDLIHVAYAGSNLDVAVKLQLQKIYDKCPDALSDVKDKLLLTLEEKPTEEQIEEVKANDTDTAVKAIMEKLK